MWAVEMHSTIGRYGLVCVLLRGAVVCEGGEYKLSENVSKRQSPDS
jgi:hypothetical protein